MNLPPEGMLDGKLHRYPVRVYYEDTDAGGIVYHANYLRFAERARTEMLRCIGISHKDMITAHGVTIIVSGMEIDFRRPARLDDALEVRTQIIALGGASIKMSQLIAVLDGKPEDVLARIILRLACVNGEGRPERLPDAFLERGAPLVEESRV